MLPRSSGLKGIVGIWNDDKVMISAARKSREAGFQYIEAITPFPLHEIDGILGIPRSPLPWVTFVMGLTGCSLGVWFTWWASSVSWALNIGGKPFMSFPAFIPVIFELTILFAALSSVVGCFAMCGLPKIDPPIIDPDLTSHKFALFIPSTDKNYNQQKIEALFKEQGAAEVKYVADF
jgi:hypothetical protein